MENISYIVYDILNFAVRIAVISVAFEVIQYIRLLRIKKIMEIKEHEQ